MLRNNIFNLMNQIVQESKSLWRIKNNYMQESVGNDEVMAIWRDIEKSKEDHIARMQAAIKKMNVQEETKKPL